MALIPESSYPVAFWRDRIARLLLGLIAVAAVAGAASLIPEVIDAAGDAKTTKVWRAYGLVTFAGLFVLLAWRPRSTPGLWELTILNKLALAVTGAFWTVGEVDGAGAMAAADGVLTAVLIACYALTRGWTAWSSSAGRGPGA
ncbi:hypothetical protein HLB23_27150 [Nocardia uniformis]|uniref:Uncharacterized protein n=1 Tax=Nocardia uniformis TaxID=53432 RepID=A0A849CAY7_9NOCA|nr:hypothetical protein [Nocardia uniformis]NNH73490.1 hypothetical protein [Nocardia uniformis]